MPNYGYRCAECKHEFSIFQSMKDDPVKICPECSGEVRRLMYPVGLVFKGSGWSINDSRKPEPSEAGEKPADKTETKSDAATATAGETKSETPKAETTKTEPSKANTAT